MKKDQTVRRRGLSAFLALLLCLSLLPGAALAADSIAINDTNFPDANFRAVVAGFDANKDNTLSADEIAAVTTIDCTVKSIASLEGIGYFTNLEILDCSSNQLTALDVSKNTSLTGLDCHKNQLMELDVSPNTALTMLYCSENQLTKLDVSKNTALDVLDCSGNQLTALDVSQNTKLTMLYCTVNQLTALDISSNTALVALECSGNQLTTLDVSKNTKLGGMACSGNQLTSLDVSQNTALDGLVCENNEYTITVDSNRTFDLTGLPTGFIVSKASKWQGGSVNGNILTVDAGAAVVTYSYDLGYTGSSAYVDKTVDFTLSVKSSSSDIAIDVSNFPDANFRTVVADFDTDKNGTLSAGEIAAVTEFDFRDSDISITSLTGIEHFTALESLYCNDKQLTELNVSSNTALKSLRCDGNKLTSLDIGSNTALNWLNCSGNQLVSLDVSQNTALKELYCSGNQLTALNIGGNTDLGTLNCSGNQLTALDISKNTWLTWLDCSDNQLTALDVSKNTRLGGLWCSGNRLTSLNVSGMNLNNMECADNRYQIAPANGVFDLATLPAGFDVSKASGWTGGTVSGNTLTVDSGADKVTYEYDCGNNHTATFTLQIAASAYGFALSQTEDYGFSDLKYGYTDVTPLTVTVTNTGAQETSELTIRSSNGSDFTVTPESITNIPAGGSATFTVQPVTGLHTAFYGSTVTVTGGDVRQSFYVYMNVVPAGKVAAPVIRPGGGSFTGTQTVTITCATQGAYIAYTTDGSEVSVSSTPYTGPITLTETTTIKAQATMADMDSSDTVTAVFTRTSGGGSSGSGGSSSSGSSVSVDRVKNGTITVSPKSAGKGSTVTVTVTPDEGYELDIIQVLDKDGKELKLTDKGSGKYTFTMPAGKVEVKAGFVEKTPEQIFADGVGNGLFAPDQSCTRAQIVTFLYRIHQGK